MKFATYLDEKLRLTLKYHDKLNPKIWKKDKLDPELVKYLIKVSMRFAKFSGIPVDRVHDIVMTGGNANYNYTKFSDIDIHLMCDETGLDKDHLYQKKVEWTQKHPELRVMGYPIEMYAADETEPYPHGQGFYSLIKDKWLIVPKHLDKVDVLTDPAVHAKIEWNMKYIRKHLLSKKGTKDEILSFKEKMWRGRTAGLQRAGEFSVENVLYKELRNRGLIQKLNDKLASME